MTTFDKVCPACGFKTAREDAGGQQEEDSGASLEGPRFRSVILLIGQIVSALGVAGGLILFSWLLLKGNLLVALSSLLSAVLSLAQYYVFDICRDINDGVRNRSYSIYV